MVHTPDPASAWRPSASADSIFEFFAELEKRFYLIRQVEWPAAAGGAMPAKRVAPTPRRARVCRATPPCGVLQQPPVPPGVSLLCSTGRVTRGAVEGNRRGHNPEREPIRVRGTVRLRYAT